MTSLLPTMIAPSAETQPEEMVNDCIAAITSTFFSLRAVAEHLHQEGDLTSGRRAVLLDLLRLGPNTVPQLARMRPVTRQSMQRTANSLTNSGYAEFSPNPGHRGSPLLSITKAGRQHLKQMLAREKRLIQSVADEIGASDLLTTLATLKTFNAHLQSSLTQIKASQKAERA